jgi:hypothetical protein
MQLCKARFLAATFLLAVFSSEASLASLGSMVDSVRPIQDIFVIDTIVQLPVDFDTEVGVIRSFGDGVCLFTYAIKDTMDGIEVGFARLNLDSWQLDTLRFEDSADSSDTSVDKLHHGQFKSLSHYGQRVSILYDSLIIIAQIQGRSMTTVAEYRVPAGFYRQDWLNENTVILRPPGYMGPTWPHQHRDIHLVDVETGAITKAQLPDDEAAIFQLFSPDRFVVASDGVLWYLRPTDGSLFRREQNATWTLVVEAGIKPSELLVNLARASESKEHRSFNRLELIDSVELLIENSRSAYASYLMIDSRCKLAYICDYRGQDSTGDYRSSHVRVVPLSGANVFATSPWYSDPSAATDVQCRRTTYPVSIALRQAVIVGDYLYALGDRAAMSIAYDERLTLRQLRTAEFSDQLHNGAKFAITRYRYIPPCAD